MTYSPGLLPPRDSPSKLVTELECWGSGGGSPRRASQVQWPQAGDPRPGALPLRPAAQGDTMWGPQMVHAPPSFLQASAPT